MTERTVTVTQEVEETVTVCDECGLGEDGKPGEIVEYKTQTNTRTDPTLHFHESCADKRYGGNPETVAERINKENVYSPPILAAFTKHSLLFYSFGLTIMAAAVVLRFTTDLTLAFPLIFLSGFLSLTMLLDSRKKAVSEWYDA